MSSLELSRAERAELETLRRRQQLLDRSQVVVLIYDADTFALTYWNRGAERAFGWTQAEVLGKQPFDVLQTRFPIPRSEIAAALARDGQAENRVEIITRSGEILQMHCLWTMIPGAEGRTGEIITVAQDVTEMTHAQAAMTNSEARFRAFMDHLPALAYIKDSESRIRYVNRTYEKTFETALPELEGQMGSPGTSAEFLTERMKNDRWVLDTGAPETYIETSLGPGGGLTHWQSTKFPIHEADGRVLLGGISIDISELLAIEKEREEHLQQLDRYKDEFLSVVSHELRTPLNFIMGFASILEDDLARGEVADLAGYTAMILQGAERMLALINNLLDMSQIAAGRFSVSPSPTSIEPLVNDVIATMGPLANQKRIAIGCVVRVTHEVVVDPQRLVQVLTNFLSNALKFTPREGRVELLAEEREGGLFIEVRDTGPGIPDEDSHRLFKRFSQLDMSSTRHSSGTGLGLAICKSIVEAHGGEIGVRRHPEAGAIFWVSLPPGGGSEAHYRAIGPR